MKALKSGPALVLVSLASGTVLSIYLSYILGLIVPVNIAENILFSVIEAAFISFVKNLLMFFILLPWWDSGRTLRDIQAKAKRRPRSAADVFLRSVFALTLCLIFNAVIAVLFGMSGPEQSDASYTAVDIISMALVPAVIEETSYRYIIFGCFSKYGADLSVVISSVLFALSHTTPTAIAYAFLCGLVLGNLYRRTRCLSACMAVHFLNNAILIAISTEILKP